MKYLRCLLAVLALAGLSTVARAQERGWWEARTSRFIVYTEGTEAQARKYATDLERFDRALRTMQALPITAEDIGDANRVTIYRFGDTDDIGRMVGAQGVYGFYLPYAGQPVAYAPIREARDSGSLRDRKRVAKPTDLDPESVLKHEYVHHFMLYNFPATYPGWYTEGFAEFYATLELKDDGSFHVGHPPQYRSAQLFDLQIMPTEQLFDSSRRATWQSRLQNYSLGWLLIHYLSFNKPREGQLNAYLVALGKGEDSLVAARRIFGDLKQLDRELRDYRRAQLPGLNVRPAAGVPLEVAVRRVSPVEAETMPIRLELDARLLTRSRASGYAKRLAEIDRRFPNEALVWRLKAEAHTRAREYDEADAAADKAMQLAPRSMEALLAKAGVALARERKQPGSAKAARPLYARASRLDGRDPRPLIGYYLTFREARETAPEAAIIGLEDAFKTAAHDDEYRYVLGMQLLSEGRAQPARNVLMPIVVQTHGMDRKKNKLLDAMKLIEEGKPKEAYDLLWKDEEERRQKAEAEGD